MAFYYRYLVALSYIIFLSIGSAHATNYWMSELNITTDVKAKGRLAEFETGITQDDIVKGATLSFMIDVKTAVVVTAKDRLFNNTSSGGQFSTTGESSITSLLTNNAWTVDKPTKTIYKLTNSYGCKNFGYKWKNNRNTSFTCPNDAANNAIEPRCVGNISNCKLEGLYTDNTFKTKIDTLPDTAQISEIYARFSFSYYGNPTGEYIGEKITKDEKLGDGDKKLITDDEFFNLLYTDKTILKQLFTPYNVYEVTNNKAYLKLAYALSTSSNVLSDDTSIKPETDETGTSTGGWKIPEFCDYAKPACIFFDWMKEEVTGETDTEVDIQKSDVDANHNIDKKYFAYEGGCPADYIFEISIFGYSDTATISYKPYCDYVRALAPYLYFISWLAGAFIVAGVRNA